LKGGDWKPAGENELRGRLREKENFAAPLKSSQNELAEVILETKLIISIFTGGRNLERGKKDKNKLGVGVKEITQKDLRRYGEKEGKEKRGWACVRLGKGYTAHAVEKSLVRSWENIPMEERAYPSRRETVSRAGGGAIRYLSRAVLKIEFWQLKGRSITNHGGIL